MNRKIASAVVVLSTLFGASAFADGYHRAQPTYAPPAPVYTAPAPTYVSTTIDYGDEYRGWREREWRNFQREQAMREQNENNYLAQERASFIANWGWDARRMSWLDQHQAQERNQFEAEQSARVENFRNELAMRGRGHGRHFHEADYDFD